MGIAQGWNYADLWEAVAQRYGDEPAMIHGDRRVAWRDFDDRADGVARSLLDAGLQRQDKVAQYLRNRPEYMESMFAVFKAGLVPVNTNYRYGDDELTYLWDNCDAAAVVFDAEFTDTCARLRTKLTGIRHWLRIGDEANCPDWATSYEEAATSRPGRVVAEWGRSGDDLYLLYTGGTTGMPKGVMWRQDDMFRMLEAQQGSQVGDAADPAGFVAALTRPGMRALPAPPLMHGAGCWFIMPFLCRGGAAVTLTGASLDAVELLETMAREKIRAVCIVGEAFARPMLRELEADPARWDLSELRAIVSSGAMLSAESKMQLLKFAPKARIFDGLGTSESGTMASTVTDGGSKEATARFKLTPKTRVVDESGRDVVPGSGEAGRLAIGGFIPLGYYGDAEKTAATFVELDAKRYVIAGDWATVDVDGTITLLGRGSSVINTAGEKVYPEEVEEVLKQADGVHDAAVVGVPDERFGERIVALVEPDAGSTVDEAALIAHVKQRLATYKAPRQIISRDSLERGPNGKLDHRRLRQVAIDTAST